MLGCGEADSFPEADRAFTNASISLGNSVPHSPAVTLPRAVEEKLNRRALLLRLHDLN